MYNKHNNLEQTFLFFWEMFISPTNEIRVWGGVLLLESGDSLSGGQSVVEMLCLKLFSQFSSHLH